MSRISSVLRMFACASCGRHNELFGGVACVVPHEEGWSKFDGHGISYCTKESGMKPGQSRRQRPSRKRCSEREKEEYTDGRPYTQCSGDGQVFSLKWFSTSKARVCYGCGRELRSSISTVPDAPFDVVLTTKEYRSWFDKNANTIEITTKPESTHYHINPVCVL